MIVSANTQQLLSHRMASTSQSAFQDLAPVASNPTMKHLLPLVLVLWGHHCDEISAVTALVQHRRAGRRAQLVGLDKRNRRGANGVLLVTDLTLSEALVQANHVHSIILPMNLADFVHYLDDPRVVTLLQIAIDNGAALVALEIASSATIAQIAQAIQRDTRDRLQILSAPP